LNMDLDYKIRPIISTDFKWLFTRMRNDFPPQERAPFFAIRRNLKNGIFEGFILTDDKSNFAYSLDTLSKDNSSVLLNYLAVEKAYRNKGLGTVLLELLQEHYVKNKAIIVEVERSCDTKNNEENKIREARISFYSKCGFFIVPDIEYSIFGIPMHLMVWSSCEGKEEIRQNICDIMDKLYIRILPRSLHSQMKVRLLN